MDVHWKPKEEKIEGNKKMKKKYMRIKLTTGEEWDVDLETIINDRSQYYFERYPEEFGTLKKAIKESKDLIEGDSFEAEDWMRNSMNWKDIKAVKVKEAPELDEPNDWMNADMEVIEK